MSSEKMASVRNAYTQIVARLSGEYGTYSP